MYLKESDACPEFIEGMTYFGSDCSGWKEWDQLAMVVRQTGR